MIVHSGIAIIKCDVEDGDEMFDSGRVEGSHLETSFPSFGGWEGEEMAHLDLDQMARTGWEVGSHHYLLI